MIIHVQAGKRLAIKILHLRLMSRMIQFPSIVMYLQDMVVLRTLLVKYEPSSAFSYPLVMSK